MTHMGWCVVTLTTLWADSSDDNLMIFFLFLLENRIWHFMQIVTFGDAWSVKSYFLRKIKKIFQSVVCWNLYPACKVLSHLCWVDLSTLTLWTVSLSPPTLKNVSHIFGTMHARIWKFHVCIAYEKLADRYLFIFFFFCQILHGGVRLLFRLRQMKIL